MRVDLVLLTGGAALNITADEGSEARPPKFCSDELAGFKEARVSSGLVIVASLEDSTAERVISRDIDVTFVGEDAGFYLPVGEARAEGKRNVFMHGLEGLEDKGVTC